MRDLISELEDWNNGHKIRTVDISIDNGYGATCWSVKLSSESGVIVVCETNLWQVKEPDGVFGNIPYWEGKNKEYVFFAVMEDDFIEWPGLRPTLEKALDVVNAMGLLPLSKKKDSVLSNNQTRSQS